MIIKAPPCLFDFKRSIPVEVPNDITISRHRGAETSIEANRRVAKGSDRAKVLEIIKARGSATSKEVAAEMGRELNRVSGRFSELLVLKLITYFKDERRDGCRVYYPR